MYSCRCPEDNRKLAELGRPPLRELKRKFACPCGSVLDAGIRETPEGRILAEAGCSCGRRFSTFIGHAVRIKCGKCSRIRVF